MKQLVVYKGRTNIITVSLGYDVSNDIITSEIRVDKDSESELIATWEVAFESDGIDGELVLTLDDFVTSEIEKAHGYMDIKRVTAGEPINVFNTPIEVLFQSTVTV